MSAAPGRPKQANAPSGGSAHCAVGGAISAEPQDRPEGFRRVGALLAEQGHAHASRFLEVAARTAREAADALGVSVGPRQPVQLTAAPVQDVVQA